MSAASWIGAPFVGPAQAARGGTAIGASRPIGWATPMSAPPPAPARSPLPADSSATPAHRPSAMARVRAIWANRRIMGILIVRDLKVRYSGSVLGFAWTLLDPLLLTLTYWFLFGFIVSRGASNEQPYLLWLLTGILPYMWTSRVLMESGRLLGNDAKLVTSSSLPREIWVLRSVTSNFIDFLFTLPITVVAVLLYLTFGDALDDRTTVPSVWIWLIPLAFAVQFLLNLGLALFFAPLCMLYPDVHRLVRVFTMLYRYLSPVIYGLGFLEARLSSPAINWPSWMLVGDQTWPEWLIYVYALNPLVGILNVYHAVLFPDNVSDVLTLLGLSAVISTILFVFGWWLFRRLEARVLKEI